MFLQEVDRKLNRKMVTIDGNTMRSGVLFIKQRKRVA